MRHFKFFLFWLQTHYSYNLSSLRQTRLSPLLHLLLKLRINPVSERFIIKYLKSHQSQDTCPLFHCLLACGKAVASLNAAVCNA